MKAVSEFVINLIIVYFCHYTTAITYEEAMKDPDKWIFYVRHTMPDRYVAGLVVLLYMGLITTLIVTVSVTSKLFKEKLRLKQFYRRHSRHAFNVLSPNKQNVVEA